MSARYWNSHKRGTKNETRIYTSQGKTLREKNPGSGEVKCKRVYHTSPIPSSNRPGTETTNPKNHNNQPDNPQRPGRGRGQRGRYASQQGITARGRGGNAGRQWQKGLRPKTRQGRRDYKQPLGSLGEITALGGQAGPLQQSAGVGALHGRSRAGEKR